MVFYIRPVWPCHCKDGAVGSDPRQSQHLCARQPKISLASLCWKRDITEPPLRCDSTIRSGTGINSGFEVFFPPSSSSLCVLVLLSEGALSLSATLIKNLNADNAFLHSPAHSQIIFPLFIGYSIILIKDFFPFHFPPAVLRFRPLSFFPRCFCGSFLKKKITCFF